MPKLGAATSKATSTGGQVVGAVDNAVDSTKAITEANAFLQTMTAFNTASNMISKGTAGLDFTKKLAESWSKFAKSTADAIKEAAPR